MGMLGVGGVGGILWMKCKMKLQKKRKGRKLTSNRILF